MSKAERFEQLCRKREQVARWLVRDCGRTWDDALDLVHEALVATYLKLATIAPGAEFAYLRRTARNRAINHAQRTRVGEPLDESLDDELSESVPSPEDLAQLEERIARGMRELPDETRFTVVLFHRGHTHEEIAELLGVRPATIRSRLHRAKERPANFDPLSGDHDHDQKQ